MNIRTDDFFSLRNDFWANFLAQSDKPWELVALIHDFIMNNEWLEPEYRAVCRSVWMSEGSWAKEKGLLHPPIVIGRNCTLGETATVRPNVLVGNNVTIGNGCIVKNSILMDGVKLFGNNMVSDCVLGANVVLGPGVNISNQYAPVMAPRPFSKIAGEGEIAGLKRFGAIIGDGTNIAANVRINPGTVIGRGCFIESFDIRGLVEHGIKVGLDTRRKPIMKNMKKQS